jgi:hypothetical protein
MTRNGGRVVGPKGRYGFSSIFAGGASGPPSPPPRRELLIRLGEAMSDGDGTDPGGDDPRIPAGYTYLGQFINHDLSRDDSAITFGAGIEVGELVQMRSPSLDLDSLYGQGPQDEPEFYSDGLHLKTGRTAAIDFPAGDTRTRQELDGFDLPRNAGGGNPRSRRQAIIPDDRNDENLAIGQMHAAFIRLHNRVVEQSGAAPGQPEAFSTVRAEVVKHYQWMIREDFLPRIIDRQVLEDVFQNGRRFFEVQGGQETGPATMPIEFSVAAFRLGHSMVGPRYEWNAIFQTGGPGGPATLPDLFNFSGRSGTLSPDGQTFERLPSNWVADWRRLFELPGQLAVPRELTNRARRINTRVTDPLRRLPPGAVGGFSGELTEVQQSNLAIRNLVRGAMVGLPSGQQMARLFGVEPLSTRDLLDGRGGVSGVPVRLVFNQSERAEFLNATPLWFYLLREAELHFGRLGPVGSRIVAETIHRAMETSASSIVREPDWRPWLTGRPSFTMVDLLVYTFGGDPALIAPMG